VSHLCARCGIGQRRVAGARDWCGAPGRARVPLWTAAKRWLRRSRIAAALRHRGPVVTGVAVGVTVHLAVAALGVATGLEALWQTGLLWSAQWWWALAPESVQPWAFAVLRGAVYGLLAGWLAALWAEGRSQGAVMATGEADAATAREPAITALGPPVVSPAGLTALAAYVISGWEPSALTQDRLVGAAVGAVVGRLTLLIVNGAGTRIS
jgi:hypothetical protein